MTPTPDLPDGFYACDQDPLWFRLYTPPGSAQIIIGWSIWKNRPGYRTLTITFDEWRARPENRKAKIRKDRDRTQDKEFIRDYRAIMQMAKDAAHDA